MKYQLVEYIPEQIDEGTIYISRQFELATHRCACGCGEEVVTPFSTGEWTLTIDAAGVTLHPSILNRSECNSHYWIRNSEVVWA